VGIEPRSTWLTQQQTDEARIEPRTLRGLGRFITIEPVLLLSFQIFTHYIVINLRGLDMFTLRFVNPGLTEWYPYPAYCFVILRLRRNPKLK